MAEVPIPAFAGPFEDDVLDETLNYEATQPGFIGQVAPDLATRVLGWQVDDDNQAEWAARKLAAARTLIYEKANLRDWWILQINSWFEEETTKAVRSSRFFESRLEDYAIRERVAGGRATVKVPSAEFGSIASGPKAEIVDDDEVARYVEARLVAGDDDAVKWYEAAAAAAEDGTLASFLDSLVKRSTKVYVAPFRKLVQIVERQNGYDAEVTLACTHSFTISTDGIDDPSVPVVGEILVCRSCDPDPIDGEQEHPVAGVEYVPRVEEIAVGPDGAPIPGTMVEPGGIRPKAVTLR